jgi:hypothetical protein
MDMVLLDWTRMGKQYCLAGAVVGSSPGRIVRPLLTKNRDAPVRNVGWSAYLMDGHARWELFELIGPEQAEQQPPHLEDIWVRALRPRRRWATTEQRRTILQETAISAGHPVFGEALTLTRSSAHLAAGLGQRSLATLIISRASIRFSASLREGADQPDVRAALGIPPLGERMLPVKDHHLLVRAERAATNLSALTRNLAEIVHGMGDRIAVRLGLSRPFQSDPERGNESCWLMIDGIFSLSDPQP